MCVFWGCFFFFLFFQVSNLTLTILTIQTHAKTRLAFVFCTRVHNVSVIAETHRNLVPLYFDSDMHLKQPTSHQTQMTFDVLFKCWPVTKSQNINGRTGGRE